MIEQLINMYPVTKTLRFKLIPVGKTEENFVNKSILEEDEKRADDYIKMKKYIDSYHVKFIEKVLSSPLILDSKLNDYSDLYFGTKSDETRKAMECLESDLRTQIANAFKKNKDFSKLDKKEMITELLHGSASTEEELEVIETFSKFTTYFTGFFANRKNMYSDEEKATAISYRCINENLPKFLDNIASFKKVVERLDQSILVDMKNTFLSDVVFDLSDIFSVDYFNYVLSEAGIEFYNCIIGGYVKDDVKVKGLNEYINLYNQQLSKQDKKLRLPKLKFLFKQILSDRHSVSFIPEAFNTDDEVLDSIVEYYLSEDEYGNSACNALKEIGIIISRLSEYDLSRIYFRNGSDLSLLSQRISENGSWSTFRDKWNALYDSNNSSKNKDTEKYIDARTKAFNNVRSFSLKEISELLECDIVVYLNKTINEQFVHISSCYSDLEAALALNHDSNKKLRDRKNIVELLKEFLDSIKNLENTIKSILGTGKEENKDEVFYGDILPYYSRISSIDLLYNKTRNYITKKPYSNEKIKLNFENPQLLNGWDVNKISDYRSVLFRRGEFYYLGIIDKSNSKLLEDIPAVEDRDSAYEKMVYKLLPGPNKMLPKVFFAKSNIDKYNPSPEIIRIREEETYKKGTNFSAKDCATFIAFYQQSIAMHEDWSKFGFVFKRPEEYSDISEFYDDIKKQGYSIRFERISEKMINDFVDKGQLYLFKLYNKDFSEYSKGTPNLHTLYFKMLFDSDNLNDVVYKLNGEAELFYRKASINIEDAVVHKANEPVKNKNPKNPKEQSLFSYDLIKDKRYTKPQFMLHIPITMNYKSSGERINIKVREALHSGACKHIIGIDRGERNLLYVSVIDVNGRIIHQESLNSIGSAIENVPFEVDYHDLLDRKEKERKKARQSWETIEGIKDLKEGYISQAVKRVCDLIVEYDAIVVMEDLNIGFKNSRTKVEKQVYQKFEKMLIDKLNYLVDKKLDKHLNGGLLNAYQLTEKFESFKSMGKQNGIIFYVPAWLTSKIDPTTGFVNLLKTKYTSVEDTKDFISRFNMIEFSDEENMFIFHMNYSNFPKGNVSYREEWDLYSYGERIETFRNKEKNNEWDTRKINLTSEFSDLFKLMGIEVISGLDLRSEFIAKCDRNTCIKFMRLMSLLLQLRNSITGSVDDDYIISPVKNSEGSFYSSVDSIGDLPCDADANGAFNIARKGLWLIDQLKKTEKDKLMKANLAISNKDWLMLAQGTNV